MSLAALAGAAMLTVSIGPVSAFTLSGPSLEGPVASAQIERVWWIVGDAGIRSTTMTVRLELWALQEPLPLTPL